MGGLMVLSKHPLHSISGRPLDWRGSAIPTNSFPGGAGPRLPTEGPTPRQPLSCHPFFSNRVLLTWDSSASQGEFYGAHNWGDATGHSRQRIGLPPTILLGIGQPPERRIIWSQITRMPPKPYVTNSVVPNSVYIWKLSGFLLQMSAPGLPSGRCQHLRGEALVLHLDVPLDSKVGPQLSASSLHQR